MYQEVSKPQIVLDLQKLEFIGNAKEPKLIVTRDAAKDMGLALWVDSLEKECAFICLVSQLQEVDIWNVGTWLGSWMLVKTRTCGRCATFLRVSCMR